MKFIALLLSLMLTACVTDGIPRSKQISQHEKRPFPPYKELYAVPVKIDSLDRIFGLSKAQKDDFLVVFNGVTNRHLTPNRRISSFLQQHLEQFNFFSDTLTASETLAGNQGNCLSLAILTKSLADIAQVEVGFQLVDTPPIYLRDGGIVMSSQHVRSILYNPREKLPNGFFTFLRGNVTIDYFPSGRTRTLRRVDENEFYSMYYRNKAAEALVKNDYERAFWLIKTALKIKPDDGQAVNMMAILHQRLGYSAAAEKLYRYGLKYGQEKLELLTNYHQYLVNRNYLQKAKKIAIEIDKYDQLNPFKYISQADRAFAEKNFKTALGYYKKAARIADYLDEPFVGIAKSQFMLGNHLAAAKSFKKAIKRSHKKSTTALYQAKYDRLMKQL